MVGGGHHVAQHCAGCRRAAGAAAIDHELAGGVPLDEDRIESPADACERVVTGNHGRMDSHRHGGHGPVAHALRDGQQLDLVTELVGKGDVGGPDGGDPLGVDVARDDVGVERDPGQDGGLGPGIQSFDVRRRIGLRVTEGLGLRRAPSRTHSLPRSSR